MKIQELRTHSTSLGVTSLYPQMNAVDYCMQIPAIDLQGNQPTPELCRSLHRTSRPHYYICSPNCSWASKTLCGMVASAYKVLLILAKLAVGLLHVLALKWTDFYKSRLYTFPATQFRPGTHSIYWAASWDRRMLNTFWLLKQRGSSAVEIGCDISNSKCSLFCFVRENRQLGV